MVLGKEEALVDDAIDLGLDCGCTRIVERHNAERGHVVQRGDVWLGLGPVVVHLERVRGRGGRERMAPYSRKG